jgi:hypothetical protein
MLIEFCWEIWKAVMWKSEAEIKRLVYGLGMWNGLNGFRIRPDGISLCYSIQGAQDRDQWRGHTYLTYAMVQDII